jgi:Single Cache domain 2
VQAQQASASRAISRLSATDALSTDLELLSYRAGVKFSGFSSMEETVRRSLTVAVFSAALALSPAAFAAGSGGTAEEAKAMLLKTVSAVKADKAGTLDMINKGEGGFLDRDLYPFCSNVSDGKIVAIGNPNAKKLLGQDQRTLKDANGKPFGMELFAAGQKPEGEITEVSYVFSKPGADPAPVPKVSLVGRAGDIACGVGYYK